MSKHHSAGQGKDTRRNLRAKDYNRSKNRRPPNERPRDVRGTTLRLLGLLKPFWPAVLLVLVTAVLGTFVTVFGPMLLGDAVDAIQAQVEVKLAGGTMDFGKIGRILLLLAGLFGMSAVFSYVQAYTMAGITQKVVCAMREQVNEKLSRLPLRYFDGHSKGDILSRIMNDIDNVSNTLQNNLTQILSSLVMLISVMGMMFYVSWRMTLIAISVLPACLVVTFVISRYSRRYFRRQWDHMGELNGHIEEMYTVYGFAQEAGVDRPTLHRVLKGQLVPSAPFFQKVVKTLRLFPQERERLLENYNILKNGESVFYQRAYIKKRLERFNDLAAGFPPISAGRYFAGQTELLRSSVSCIRGEYMVENVARQVFLEELEGQEHPQVSTNMLDGTTGVGRTLLQLYLEQNDRMEIHHLIRFHKSIGSHPHNLKMLFDALLFSFSSVDGYDPRFYYENVSPHANPSSLFHSYLITTKCVLCFSEEDKLAALIREPEMRMCYEQRFQQTFADAQPLLRRAVSLEEAYQMGEAFYQGKKARDQFIASGGFPCLALCCTPGLLYSARRDESTGVRTIVERTCRHFECLEHSTKTCVAMTTVDCFSQFLKTGRSDSLPEQFFRPFTHSERVSILKRLLSLIQAGRVELHLMNPARFHFPDQISIHASADEKCVIYAYPSNGHGGINVQIQEKTLRQAILGFLSGLPESGLLYTVKESEAILRNLIAASCEKSEGEVQYV